MLNTGKLAGYTLFITGASRGIGKSIGLKAARDGANVIIAARSAESHPKLPGTIYTAAKEIEDAGGNCLPCVVDVRDERSVDAAVGKAAKTFGGIDILVNNASAVSLTKTQVTPMKMYDLMNETNARGTYLCSKVCIPHLLKSKENGRNPHILNISPPLSMKPIWFKNHTAYTIAKYGMSMCVLGMAEEFEEKGISVNALWPKRAIFTAALEMFGGKEAAVHCRKPDIVADAAYAILTKGNPSTGKFLIDDEVLKAEGIRDFDQYAVEPGSQLMLDWFLEDPDVEMNDQFKVHGSDSSTVTDRSAEVTAVFSDIQTTLNSSLVAEIGGIFKFKLIGNPDDTWILDLKNSSGSIRQGDGKADCDITMTADDFLSVFQGKLNAFSAFTSGKLKVDGNMMTATKLEHLTQRMHKAKL